MSSKYVKDQGKRSISMHIVKRNAKQDVVLLFQKKNAWCKWSEGLATPEGRNGMFRIVHQMKKDRTDLQGTHYIGVENVTIEVKETEVRKAWRCYFGKISNEEDDIDLDEVPPIEGHIEEITFEEVRDAEKSLKSDKAPRPSDVTTEMLKHAGESAIKELHAIFQHILETQYCPKERSSSLTVALYKSSGDRLSCHTHRGLRLLEQDSIRFR